MTYFIDCMLLLCYDRNIDYQSCTLSCCVVLIVLTVALSEYEEAIRDSWPSWCLPLHVEVQLWAEDPVGLGSLGQVQWAGHQVHHQGGRVCQEGARVYQPPHGRPDHPASGRLPGHAGEKLFSTLIKWRLILKKKKSKNWIWMTFGVGTWIHCF